MTQAAGAVCKSPKRERTEGTWPLWAASREQGESGVKAAAGAGGEQLPGSAAAQ